MEPNFQHISQQIDYAINDQLTLRHLEIINESHMHSTPPDAETHFKLIIVSDDFSGLTLVKRQRKIYAILKNLLNNPIHALSMYTLTYEEWLLKKDNLLNSPNCRGGFGN